MAETEIKENPVEFEEMIDISSSSAFRDPVIEKEPLVGQQVPPSPQMNGNAQQRIESGSATHAAPAQEEYFSDNDIRKDDNVEYQEIDDTLEEEEETKTEMSPEIKKKMVTATAATLALMYQKALPFFPKKIAKISPSKLNKMALNDEIDLNDGFKNAHGEHVSVGETIERTNDRIDDEIAITNQMRDDWQDALEIVLAESDKQLSPLANLGVVTAMHATSLLTATVQISSEMKDTIQTFKDYHAKNKNETAEQHLQDEIEKQQPVESYVPTTNDDEQ